MAKGQFRQDLFHRLKVFSIEIGPLRERIEDVPRLAAYFVDKFTRELNINQPLLSPAALELLCRHTWPGNVRELEHCLHRAMILTQGYPIQPDDIRRSLEPIGQGAAGSPAIPEQDRVRQMVLEYLRSRSGTSTHASFMDLIERTLLSEAIRLCKGNQTQAAKWLGLARPTLKAKMDKYGLGCQPASPGA